MPRFSIGENKLVMRSIELANVPILKPKTELFVVEITIIRTINNVFNICITGENKAS